MGAANNENHGVRHVAVIMDGNGRWAKNRGLKHIEGHREGAKSVKRAIEAAREFGIEYLTLYAFSTENWKRPGSEVKGLMSLLGEFIDDNLEEFRNTGIRLRTIGRTEQLPKFVVKKLLNAIEETKSNDKGTLIVALNYGGRAEITDAAKKIAQDVKSGKIKPDSVDEKLFSSYLYAPDIPDPDLLIRTSGEFRISNFLLWQLSYSEIYISEVLWPDFDKEEFGKAVESYRNRHRRYGGR